MPKNTINWETTAGSSNRLLRSGPRLMPSKELPPPAFLVMANSKTALQPMRRGEGKGSRLLYFPADHVRYRWPTCNGGLIAM